MLMSDSRRTLQSLYASNLKTLGQHDIPARHRNLLQGRGSLGAAVTKTRRRWL